MIRGVLHVAGADPGLVVVAVALADVEPVTVLVGLLVIHQAVAVVVDPVVALLEREWVDGGVGVVAVLGLGPAVPVEIVVHEAVAVVVDAVDHLGGVGVDEDVGVVAVAVHLGEAVAVIVLAVEGVVVVVVAGLHRAADLAGGQGAPQEKREQ